jgi:protein SCO1
MRGVLLAMGLVAASLASAQFYGKYQEVPKLNSGRVASSGGAAGVRVMQKLNERVPLDVPFMNERGEKTTLGQTLRGKPAVFLPVFFNCTGICTVELNKLMESLNGMKRSTDWVGTRFDVIVFSIDPREDWKLAKQKEGAYLELYRPKGYEKLPPKAVEGFTFLTGSIENIRKVTDAIGFEYRIDRKTGDIVHPAALLVLTPQGMISRYFLSDTYPTRLLLDSIKDAGQEVIGDRDDAPFFLSCISLDPHTGEVTVNVMNTVKTGGVVTVIALIGALIFWERRGRQFRREKGEPSA